MNEDDWITRAAKEENGAMVNAGHLTTSAIQERCQCCGVPLKNRHIVMLELDRRNNTYHNFNNVPEEWSQGWFPFGSTCAKRQIAKARAAIQQVEP